MTQRTADVRSFCALPAFDRLKQTIIARTGLAYYADKDALLAELIQGRIHKRACSEEDYFHLLQNGADEEFAALIDEITVGETYFFRNPQQFESLANVILPDCVARRKDQGPVRIWCAGCASGAEPYSISILIERDSTMRAAGIRYEILGTDINRKALTLARTGVYSPWDLRGVNEAVRNDCFVGTERGLRLDPSFKHRVQFQQQNLVSDIERFSDANAGAFDLILCRNVMIYFAPDVMQRLLRGFRECLAPGGWFLVGHAEPYFEIANYLSPVTELGPAIYRKITDAAPCPVSGDAPQPDLFWIPPPAAAPEDPIQIFEMPAPPAAIDVAVPLAESIFDKVKALSAAGAWDHAIALCEDAMRETPLDPFVYYVYALVSQHVGAHGAVADALRHAIYLDRHFVLAHYRLACLRMAEGAWSPGERSMRTALKILDARDAMDPVPLGDGLTVGELKDLIRSQIGAEHVA